MKELSIEEKARRYDEAIERAKSVIEQNPLMEYLKKGIEYIFTELKESEDEKIRKWIKKELASKYVVDNIVNNMMADKAFAWLEKKGEQKPAWSEEDEVRFKSCINVLQTSDGYDTINAKWLKSLRHQNTWKPSDAQMKALSDINVTGGISYAGQGQELINLYNALKKLRGE